MGRIPIHRRHDCSQVQSNGLNALVVDMAMDAYEAQMRRLGSMLGRGLVVAMGTTLAMVLMVVLGTTSSVVWTKRAATVWPGNTMENVRIYEAPNDRSGRGKEQTTENDGVSKGPYLEHRNFKVLLRNTEPKTGTTALEWTFQALFKEACAEFWRSSNAKSGNCSVDHNKGSRTYSMDLNGSKIVFNAMHKHYLDFQGFVYPMGPIVRLVKACMEMGLSGWSSSCAKFAETGIPTFQPKEGEQLLYINIYRDPIAAANSMIMYNAENELDHEELNAKVLDVCSSVAARIGLRARIAWKILPGKGYPVYSYAYESFVGDQEKWAADLLRAIGLHMSMESVRKALNSVSPTSMKHLLEDAKKGLVKDLPAGLEVSGVNSRKVGMATSKGYHTLLSNATVASCRRASLKHLPLALALKYQLG